MQPRAVHDSALPHAELRSRPHLCAVHVLQAVDGADRQLGRHVHVLVLPRPCVAFHLWGEGVTGQKHEPYQRISTIVHLALGIKEYPTGLRAQSMRMH